MGQRQSVEAVLSAKDRDFVSTMKQAISATDSLADKIKSGFAFGVLTGVGQQAFSMLTQGAKDLVGEIESANATWKTFTDNMSMLGKSTKDIKNTKKELQDFAEKTIYSSSDMASTYSQLEAVGTKNTTNLVKAFGGLAAAAENPQQAMKTLSQQATQMAAKPEVAWQDFKLMLEQTPAGISQVAKAMGMTTSELVKKIQDGEVATKDFFTAIEKAAGEGTELNKMAQQYKTIGQALGGLQETLANKLGPTWQTVSTKAIGYIDKLITYISKVDFDKLMKQFTAGAKKAKPYWDELVKVGKQVWEVLKKVGGVLKKVGKYFLDNADQLSKLVPWLIYGAVGFKAFKVVNSVAPGVMKFSKAILGLAKGGIGKIAGKLFPVAAAEKATGSASQTSAGQVMAAAKAFLMLSAAVVIIAAGFALLAFSAIKLAQAGPLAIGVMFGLIAAMAALGFGMTVMLKTLAPMSGQLMQVAVAFVVLGAAVLLIAAGFALLAFAAISLANAGPLAIAVMVGLVAVIALLAVGAAALGTALTAGAIGFLAFGAALLLAGAGALLAAVGISLLADKLPMIAMFGQQAALSIMLLGAGLMVFAAGALLAGAGAMVLGAGLLVATAGFIALGVGSMLGAVGMLLMAAALKAVNSSMKSISKNAKSAEKSLKSMQKSVSLVESGLDAIGSKAKSAMKGLLSAFNNAASKTKSAGKKAGSGFADGMKSGMNNAKTAATTGVNTVTTRLQSGQPRAYSAGAWISIGFANGMLSQLSIIRSAANQMAIAAQEALEAQAQISSPSKVTTKDGQWFGQGYANGILDKVKAVKAAAEKLVSIPTLATPNFAMAFGGELSSDYGYTSNSEYVIEVPLAVDGKEFARATAKYSQSELNKAQARENRKRGKL